MAAMATTEPSADGDSSFVEMKEVTRTYKARATSVTALSEINLCLGRGERVALLGRSGSGKSTLLNILGGLDRPTEGSIRVGEQKLSEMSREEMATYRLHSVGTIYQAFHLIPSRTAVQNVELPFVFDGRPRGERRKAALEALEAVGLKERARHRPHQLSGGEQQRVAIARAMINKPSLLLADEPTGNLDSATSAEVIEKLTTFSNENQTAVVLVTHDEELAGSFADRIVRLKDGRVTES